MTRAPAGGSAIRQPRGPAAPRALVVSASAGAGHVRAAQAVEEAFAADAPDVEVRHVDILDYVSSAYRKAYAGGFLAMVNRAPTLWGVLYRATDVVRHRKVRARVSRFLDTIEFAGFLRDVRDWAPDVVVCTHFLPLQVLAPARAAGSVTSPTAATLTDFDAHAFWVQPSVDRFFVATEELAVILAGRGVSASRIQVSGIPISRRFSSPLDRRRCRAELGLDPDLPVVLVTSGAAAVGAFEETVRAVLDFPPVQVLAVAGRNERLRGELERIRPRSGTSVRVFGFVDTMAELMAAADVCVAKSGGLTTAECLAMGLPLVVRDPIPGQEDRNADYLLEIGAGLKAHGVAALRYKLHLLLADTERLSEMSRAARQHGRPNAAAEIVDTVLGMAGLPRE